MCVKGCVHPSNGNTIAAVCDLIAVRADTVTLSYAVFRFTI